MRVAFLLVFPFLFAACGEQALGPAGDTPVGGSEVSLASKGKALFKENCARCHSLGTDIKVGPGLRGIYNTDTLMADGTTVVADENYLRESILSPGSKVPDGWAGARMPSLSLTDDEVDALVEYIKTL